MKAAAGRTGLLGWVWRLCALLLLWLLGEGLVGAGLVGVGLVGALVVGAGLPTTDVSAGVDVGGAVTCVVTAVAG